MRDLVLCLYTLLALLPQEGQNDLYAPETESFLATISETIPVLLALASLRPLTVGCLNAQYKVTYVVSIPLCILTLSKFMIDYEFGNLECFLIKMIIKWECTLA